MPPSDDQRVNASKNEHIQEEEASPVEGAPMILLIEDDPEVATGLKDFFGLEGYRATIVADGAEVLSAIRSASPDLIVLDLCLPKKDGFEVLQEIRGAGIGLPIVVLTVLAGAAHRTRCLKLGADAYLKKPFNLAGLAEQVQRLLAPGGS